jgi:hypothetical protein
MHAAFARDWVRRGCMVTRLHFGAITSAGQLTFISGHRGFRREPTMLIKL